MAIPGVAQVALAVNVKVTEISTTLIDRLTIATQEVVKCANPTEDVALPADLDRTVIASGLDQPTDFRFLPDGRILVVEKTGGVKILENTSQLNTPITAGVIGAATDRELGAVELDPNFDDNGYFYVAYTTTDYHDRLSRFTLANDVMDPASEFVLIDEADSGAMHHGNTMLFGPDGKLYWGFGDNALNTNGQDLSTIYGKILRINPDGTIPEDNPFYATPGARKEVYAYGFRNPFRMTFTPTGELLVGDVGDQAWEELNNVVAGGNYGWPSAEGSCSDCGYVNAVYEYPHTPPPGRAGSITTVTVYSGTSLPELYQNKVFVSDYTLRWMKVLTFDPTYTTVLDEQTIDTDAGTAVQLLQGPDGNLYQLNIFPGTLYRIAASGGNRAPSATLTASPPNGLSPLTVQFSSAGSTDPDAGTTLSYVWDFGDGAASTEPNPTRTYTVNGNYTVTLIVSDGEKTGTASQNIIVGSTAPNVQILTPVDESRYNAGNTISFSAMATDPEDGELPDSAYRWTVIFHHADHIHPYQDNIVGPTGTVTLSTSEHNVDTTWYEFAVTVTDTSGLSTTRSTSIKPNLVALTFAGSETGATYTIDGIPHSGIHTEQAVVGVVRDLDVPSPQVVNGAKLTFNNWSDGGTKQHQISTPATDTTYTVTFDRTSLLA
jgi:glucose/arabinose dehydrogenase